MGLISQILKRFFHSAKDAHQDDLSNKSKEYFLGKNIVMGIGFLPTEAQLERLQRENMIQRDRESIIVRELPKSSSRDLSEIDALEFMNTLGLLLDEYNLYHYNVDHDEFVVSRIYSSVNRKYYIKGSKEHAFVGGKYICDGIEMHGAGIETKDDGKKYEVWPGRSRQVAIKFLRQIPAAEIPPLYYIIVETPEGNIGKDLDGMFDERTGADIH